MLRPLTLVRLALSSCLLGCGPEADAAACYGVCGEGTRCESGKCIAIPAAPEEAKPAAPEAKAGKRGRRRGSAIADDADDVRSDSATYQPVADGHIPRYDANATTVLDPDAGSERLGDATVRAELRGLEPAFDRCIADAVAGGVTIPAGRVDFVFGLTAKGKVDGVTAKAPAALRDTGILGCLRKVIHDHRFPTYDGPPMGVDYTFEVG